MSDSKTKLKMAGVEVQTSNRVASGTEERLPYEKPHLYTIALAAEEVMSVGCKLSGGPGGPVGASCTSSACFAAGS